MAERNPRYYLRMAPSVPVMLTLMLGAFWALLALFPASAAGQSTTSSLQQEISDGSQVAATPKHRQVDKEYYQFSLSVPTDWLKNEGLSKKDYFTSQTLIEDDDALGWVFAYFPADYEESHIWVELIISEQAFPLKYLNKQSRQLKRERENQFRQFLPEAELLEFTVIEEPKRNALSFDLLLPFEDTNIRQSYYLTSGPRFNYQLRVNRPEDSPDEVKEQLTTIISSFNTPPPVYRIPKRDPWKYYVFPALFAALTIGLVVRAWRTSRRLKEE